MNKTVKLLAVAGLLGGVAMPSFAQMASMDVAAMTCADFTALAPEGQVAAITSAASMTTNGTATPGTGAATDGTTDSATGSTTGDTSTGTTGSTTGSTTGTGDDGTTGVADTVTAQGATLTPAEIATITATNCTTQPEQLMIDAMMARP